MTRSDRDVLLIGLTAATVPHVGFVLYFGLLGVIEMAAYNAASIGYFMALWWLVRSRDALTAGQVLTVLALVAGEVVLHVVLATLYIGHQASFHYYLFPLLSFPVVMPIFRRASWTALLALSVSTTYIAIVWLAPQHQPFYELTGPVERITQFLNIASSLGVLALLGFVARQRNERLEAEVRVQFDRAEALLLNVLPASVALRLKSEPGPIADRYDDLTVLFADLVGFTPMSAVQSPAETVLLLNEIYSAFDAVCERHGVEKIRTIGDGYMAVAGAPEPRDDHAQVMARVALELMEHIASRTEGLRMRVGLNSGPAVAGIVGTSKFHYDVWSDAVNVAARMESHGEPGRVHISAATASRLDDAFELEPRGTIEVKGKGAMETFFVLGPRRADADGGS